MAPSPVLGRISHRFPFQNRTDSLAVGRTLIVHPHLPVLTRGADVRMPHKPLLDVERSLGPPQQGLVLVAEVCHPMLPKSTSEAASRRAPCAPRCAAAYG